jgi:hypothetical protein
VTFLFVNNLSPALVEALRKLGKSVAHVAELDDLEHVAASTPRRFLASVQPIGRAVRD